MFKIFCQWNDFFNKVFSWFWMPERLNKCLCEEWNVCTYILQWHNRHKWQWEACPTSHNLLDNCDSRKVFIITTCVLLTTSGLEFQKDCQTILIRLSCFCQDQFTRSNFCIQSLKFNFLWRTYSPVSDDFCNLPATRVGTNGECKK